MGFSRQQLESYRDATVPDLIGDACRLLFVGINPGLWTAATQTHFCHPSNRFYPALLRAGLIEWTVDTDRGLGPDQQVDFVRKGMGITNLVARATARASELDDEELRRGAVRLEEAAAAIKPVVVAVAGLTAYRTAFAEPRAKAGRQERTVGEASTWVVPNPSGLNAHETIESLADWYARAADAAGITR